MVALLNASGDLGAVLSSMSSQVGGVGFMIYLLAFLLIIILTVFGVRLLYSLLFVLPIVIVGAAFSGEVVIVLILILLILGYGIVRLFVGGNA